MSRPSPPRAGLTSSTLSTLLDGKASGSSGEMGEGRRREGSREGAV